MKKKVLLTGITGQLGSYLAEKFLDMNYEVHGIIRRSSSFNTGRIDQCYDRLKLYYGDVTDTLSIDSLINEIKPDYMVNCAAQSHVAVSFQLPEYTGQVDAIGVLRILESIKKHCPNCKLVQMSTSELYGKAKEIPQSENTPFDCQSPYSCAKLYAFHMTKLYRDAYHLWASNIICFNMESERRGSTFVTKKITEALSKINYKNLNNEDFYTLKLGNLYSKRDWGHCPDYADGIIKLLQQEKADDFVLATNETHTIKEFVEESLKHTSLEVDWVGEGKEEKAIDKKTGKVIVEIDVKYFRPAEVDLLLGDYSKAKRVLGWEPTIKFKELVKIMMLSDLNKYKK